MKQDLSREQVLAVALEDYRKNLPTPDNDLPKTNWAELGKDIYNQGFPNRYDVNLTKPYVEKPPVVNAPAVAQTSVSTPPKSMTSIHIGLFVGGVVVGYLLSNYMKK